MAYVFDEKLHRWGDDLREIEVILISLLGVVVLCSADA
jgi:hypothetical protein